MFSVYTRWGNTASTLVSKIQRNFSKLNHVTGPAFRTSKQKVNPISKAVNDENGGGFSKKATLNSHESATSEASYNSWVVEHPSALESFDQMMKAAKEKMIAVFLDYDGTLSPIVDDPDSAFMSEEMREAVCEVVKCFPTAIISGRSREKVKEFVQLSNVYYAGSHGMDILAPPRPIKVSDGKNLTAGHDEKGNDVLFQPAKEFLPAIQEDYKILQEKVKSVVKNYQKFYLSEGKKVMEIRPSIEWDKGHALLYLLDTLGLNHPSNVLPLYIGDDRTDEDAFKVIKSRGQGYPIIVSSTPKETEASYSLTDPSEVLTFLRRLARWRKSFSK